MYKKNFQPLINDTDGNIRNRLKILTVKTGRKKTSLATQAMNIGLKKIEKTIRLNAEEGARDEKIR